MPSVIDFNPSFVDVDFETEITTNPILIDEGVVLGCLDSMNGGNFASFETEFADYDATEALITRAQALEEARKQEAEKNGASWLVTRIFDQDGEGACVSDAWGQAFETRTAFTYGLENVTHVSAISLYQRIGRSAQSGANVGDGAKEMMSRGILPLDTPENRARFGDQVMPNIGFRAPKPAGWEKTAKEFVVLEVKVIRTMDAMWTALAKRRPVVVGRRGHSICYTGLAARGNDLFAPYANSWKITWGQAYGNMSGGFGFDSERYIRESSSYAFAVCAVRCLQPGETIHQTAV